MGTSPDPRATTDALHVLTEQMRQLLRNPATSTDERQVLTLAGELERLTEQVLWCRDGALALARLGEHPIPWVQLECETGVPDATLIGRLQRWTVRETQRAAEVDNHSVTS